MHRFTIRGRTAMLFDAPDAPQGGGAPPATPPAVTPAPTVPPAAPAAEETVTLTKKEHEAMQSSIAAMRREKEAADKAAKKAADDKAAADGQYQQLAEQAQAERDALAAQLKATQQEQAILAKAQDLKFRIPSYALALLPKDVDRDDPAAVEAGLNALIANDASLVSENPASPTGGLPGGGAPPQSLVEQIAEAEAKKDWKTAGALKAQQVADSVLPTT